MDLSLSLLPHFREGIIGPTHGVMKVKQNRHVSWLAQGLAKTVGPWPRSVSGPKEPLPPLPASSSLFAAFTCPCVTPILITTISVHCFLVEPNYWAALSSSSS